MTKFTEDTMPASEATAKCTNEPATKTAAEPMRDITTNTSAESPRETASETNTQTMARRFTEPPETFTGVSEEYAAASNTGHTTEHATALAEGHEKESSQTENMLRQLNAIKEREPLTDEEVDIISAFGHAMQPETEETAAEAARRIDALIPPLNEVERIGDWLYNMWDLMIDLVMSPESGNYIQERLMSVLRHLKKLDRREIENRGIMKGLWVDFPALNYALEPCFHDPTNSYYDDAFTPESVNTWLNVTTFAARLLGAEYCCYDREALYVMRDALEEHILIPGFTECRIQAACAWIAHGARYLLGWALDNVGFTNMLLHSDMTANPEKAAEYSGNIFPAGPLYNGPETVCLQRWGFWIKRFEELGKESSSVGTEAKRAALEAAESMQKVERNMGNTLSA